MENEILDLKFDSNAINPLLLKSFLFFSKEDLVLQKIIEKSENLESFVNCLLSAIICLIEREKRNNETIKNLIESNPEIGRILKERNDILAKEKNKK